MSSSISAVQFSQPTDDAKFQYLSEIETPTKVSNHNELERRGHIGDLGMGFAVFA